MIKLVLLYVIKMVLSLLKVFPLHKKRYFFMSYYGRQYSCNPRAIYEYLVKNYDNREFVWCISDVKKISTDPQDNKLITVSKNSLKYFYYLITSHFVFSNIQLETYLPKKRKSIWINTWHGGGAFKVVDTPQRTIYEKRTKKIQIENTDLYISSSGKFTEVMSDSTGIPKEKFIQIGMPRNDVLFENQTIKSEIRNKVLEYLDVPKNNYIVLYAPTYRGQAKNGEFNLDLDIIPMITSFKERFGREVTLLIRAHHAITSKYCIDSSCVVDATSYDDMQQLLIATDCLITDYSSSIWDYSLLNKACILYVPDLENYRKNRGLYMNIEEWPFDFAVTNEELQEMIKRLSVNQSKINIYHEKMVNYESGRSILKLLDIMKQYE